MGKQLTNHTEVKVGDTIICTESYGYVGLLKEGKNYVVEDVYPNPFGFYQRDYVTVQSDNPMQKVTAYLTRFSKAAEEETI